MLFNTIDFVVFFVIVLTVITIIRNRNFYLIFIVIASYFFFYYSNNFLISLLIFSTILDFYVGKEIFNSASKIRKRNLLIISIVGNLGLLGFFKYTNFAISEFNHLFDIFGIERIEMMEIILPIGISFYTFQTLSYSIDIYRNQLTPCKSLKEFAVFVAFFPQLVAGPILRASHFIPQVREKFSNKNNLMLKERIINNSNLKIGITLMSIGFFKKMFFADNIAPMVDQIFSNPIGYDSFGIILATIGFGIQLYCDFSGYSDIAIGAALILGFKIPKNFNKPYFAISPADFWHRWHISLSTWLRDYLYIPLGGNKKTESRTFLNLMTVMLIGGIWHGASWNFVVWGGLHGTYLIIQKLIQKKFENTVQMKFLKTRFGKIVSILFVQYFIFLAWIPFRVRDYDFMIYSIQKYLIWDFTYADTIDIISVNKLPIILIVLFIGLHFIAFKKINLYERIAGMSLKYWGIILIVIISPILLLYDLNPHDFIYFRF